MKTLEFLNAKKPGLELTASLLKRLLQFEKKLEQDQIEFLSKDWDTFYYSGEYLVEEKLLVNSYKNTQKQDMVMAFVPTKFSARKVFGVKWKEPIQEYKDDRVIEEETAENNTE